MINLFNLIYLQKKIKKKKMGIDANIKKELKEKWAPKAFIQGKCDMKNGVRMADLTFTIRNACRGASPTGLVTGQEIFNNIWAPCKASLTWQEALVYIFLFDYQPLVPKEKHKEQALRRKNLKLDPYPEEWVFSDLGIGPKEIIVDEFELGKGIKIKSQPNEEDKKEIELIHIERVMISFTMRSKLCTYLAKKIERTIIPGGGTVIFDHFPQGPLIKKGNNFRYMSEHRHQWGEADLAIIYWSRLFHDYPIALRTVDSDVIPTFLLYLAFHGSGDEYRTQPIYWEADIKNQYFVHMQTLQKQIQEDLKWNIADFVTAILMCGSDYVDKPDVTYNIGIKDVFRAVQEKKKDKRIQRIRDNVPWLVDSIWETARGVGKTWQVWDSTTKTYKPPSKETIDNVVRLFRFNLEYWSWDWMLLDPIPPTIEAPPSSVLNGKQKEIGFNSKDIEVDEDYKEEDEEEKEEYVAPHPLSPKKMNKIKQKNNNADCNCGQDDEIGLLHSCECPVFPTELLYIK